MRMDSSFSVPGIVITGGILMMLYGHTVNLSGGDGGGFIVLGFVVIIIGIAAFALFPIRGRGEQAGSRKGKVPP